MAEAAALQKVMTEAMAATGRLITLCISGKVLRHTQKEMAETPGEELTP